MPIDRSINMPPLPVIRVATGDSPRKPCIDIASIRDVEPELPVEALRKHDNIREFLSSEFPNPFVGLFDSAQVEPSSNLSIFSLIESR
jgi:hypothetical protein